MDNVQTPLFIPASSTAKGSGLAAGTPSLNIDDIFGDCFFTPSGETVFLDHEDGDAIVSNHEQGGPAHQMGFVTGLTGNAAPPTSTSGRTRGGSSTSTSTSARSSTKSGGAAAKKRQRPQERKMSEQQKVERRERNREHAKRSRIRKKFLLESLQSSVALLKEENEKLRAAIKTHLDEDVSESMSQGGGSMSLIAENPAAADKVLDDPDFSFIKALQTAQQNFVVTDPSLPDNPIVYATQGFLSLTGYTLPQVLGRNCRFLQGPDTDPKAVEKIRVSIEQGNDMSVCLLNYRVDGTTFWNQFFIAALRDANGAVTNFVGVQCKVSEAYARNVCAKQAVGGAGNVGENEKDDGLGGLGDDDGDGLGDDLIGGDDGFL